MVEGFLEILHGFHPGPGRQYAGGGDGGDPGPDAPATSNRQKKRRQLQDLKHDPDGGVWAAASLKHRR